MSSTTFILFGATGDLAKRKIFPALYNLFLDKQLPDNFSVIGLGRRVLSDNLFQTNVIDSLNEFSRRKPVHDSDFNRFISNFHFSSLDIYQKDDYIKLLNLSKKVESNNEFNNRLFYFSVAPEMFKTIALNIQTSGLGDVSGWKKLMIEKPFGHDLNSAHYLNNQLSKAFLENEIYRIDHYLGKNMVQKLKDLKSNNPLLSKIWDSNSIANVQISALEIVGVEERAGYYDHTGALRDMFQNHMLQVLSLVAIDNEHNLNIREEKRKVLQSIKKVSKNDILEQFVRGQYTYGSGLKSYLEEQGVSENSTTETFISVKLFIDNEKWNNVPFYIRTGKRTEAKMTKIVIEFKKDTESVHANYLEIEINPDEKITLFLNDSTNDRIPLSYENKNTNFQEAYEKLIYDAIQGKPDFFSQWDEVRLSWEFVQPVLDMINEGELPVHFYPAGKNGPVLSDELLSKDGFKWL